MLIYWLMYLVPLSMALFATYSRKPHQILWSCLALGYILVIGLRHNIGADWYNYTLHYLIIEKMSFFSMMQDGPGDIGHRIVNWLIAQWGLRIYGVNTIYATIFMFGLIQFSKKQLHPWLTFAIAVPYLTIVVVMGYSRQGVAIGLFLLALTYMQKGKFKAYVALILLATFFHKTAILLLPLGVFFHTKGLILRFIMIAPIAYGTWHLLVASKQEHLWALYIEKDLQSSGAYIRVILNTLPSLFLLIYRKEWQRQFNDYFFWYWVAIGSIGSLVFLSLFDIASTAIDRVGLYFIPIQLIVFSRLPYLARGRFSPETTTVFIMLGYTLLLFIWLNYASHAHAWVPYNNILFPNEQH